MTSKFLQLLITSYIIPVLQSVSIGQNSKSKRKPTQHEAILLTIEEQPKCSPCSVSIPTQPHEAD